MDNKQSKEGVSVKEIEKFAKQHRFEVFFALTFILASFFSFVIWGAGWSVSMAGLGGVLGVAFPAKIEDICQKGCTFVFKQEQITQLVLGVVVLILAVFIPPLIFLWLGAHGGKGIYNAAMKNSGKSQ